MFWVSHFPKSIHNLTLLIQLRLLYKQWKTYWFSLGILCPFHLAHVDQSWMLDNLKYSFIIHNETCEIKIFLWHFPIKIFFLCYWCVEWPLPISWPLCHSPDFLTLFDRTFFLCGRRFLFFHSSTYSPPFLPSFFIFLWIFFEYFSFESVHLHF